MLSLFTNFDRVAPVRALQFFLRAVPFPWRIQHPICPDPHLCHRFPALTSHSAWWWIPDIHHRCLVRHLNQDYWRPSRLSQAPLQTPPNIGDRPPRPIDLPCCRRSATPLPSLMSVDCLLSTLGRPLLSYVEPCLVVFANFSLILTSRYYSYWILWALRQ